MSLKKEDKEIINDDEDLSVTSLLSLLSSDFDEEEEESDDESDEEEASAASHQRTDSDEKRRWLAKLRNNVLALDAAPPRLLVDKGFAFSAIRINYRAFKFLPVGLQEDSEVENEYLRMRTKAIGNDKDLVMKAIQEEYRVFDFAPRSLQTDPDVEYVYCMAKAKICGSTLKDVPSRFRNNNPSRFRNNKQFVIEATRKKTDAFFHAPMGLQADREVVYKYWLSKVKYDGSDLFYAPKFIQNDKNILITVVQNRGLALRFAPPGLTNDKKVVLAAVQQNGMALQFSSPKLRDDIGVVLPTVNKNGLALEYVSTGLQNSKVVVLAAVRQNGLALQFASPELQNDKEVILAALEQNSIAIKYASEGMQQDDDFKEQTCRYWISAVEIENLGLQDIPVYARNNKQIVAAAVKRDCWALIPATPNFRNDTDLLLMAIQRHPKSFGYAPEYVLDLNAEGIVSRYWEYAVRKDVTNLRHAPQEQLNDAGIVACAVQKDGLSLKYASPARRNDAAIALAAVIQNGLALEYVPTGLVSVEIGSAAVRKNPGAAQFLDSKMREHPQILSIVREHWIRRIEKNWLQFRFAPEYLRADALVVSSAFQQNVSVLQHAPVSLFKKNKDFVLDLIKKDPDAIKYVHKDFKHDPEFLVAAGMFDENHEVGRRKTKKIVLSTRFSLNASSHSQATHFTHLLKEHEYIRNGGFKIYAPNAFDKNTCDPSWTDFDWPCRGTNETCRFDDARKTGHPTDECCWRYSFRCQLQEAKQTGGFMLQIVEADKQFAFPTVLGKGQRIEQDIAQDLHLKNFLVYRPMVENVSMPFKRSHVEQLVDTIKRWYDDENGDASECVVRPSVKGVTDHTTTKQMLRFVEEKV